MSNEVTDLLKKMDSKVDRVEEAVNRIEQNEPADIMSILKQMNDKLDEREAEIQVLNKRVFKVETEIERLTRQ